MLFMFIKLCVVRGAPWFTALAFLYLLDWFLIQLLMVLTYWKPFPDNQLQQIKVQYQRLAVDSHGGAYRVWRICTLFFWAILTGIFLSGLGFWAFHMPKTGQQTFYVLQAVFVVGAVARTLYIKTLKKLPAPSSGKDVVIAIILMTVFAVAIVVSYLFCWNGNCNFHPSDTTTTLLGKGLFQFGSFWIGIVIFFALPVFVATLTLIAASGRT
jgi:hypothetical protein